MTDNTTNINPPHDHQHVIGQFSYAEESHVKKAIDTALESREAWANMPWEQRVSIFFKSC